MGHFGEMVEVVTAYLHIFFPTNLWCALAEPHIFESLTNQFMTAFVLDNVMRSLAESVNPIKDILLLCLMSLF